VAIGFSALGFILLAMTNLGNCGRLDINRIQANAVEYRDEALSNHLRPENIGL